MEAVSNPLQELRARRHSHEVQFLLALLEQEAGQQLVALGNSQDKDEMLRLQGAIRMCWVLRQKIKSDGPDLKSVEKDGAYTG